MWLNNTSKNIQIKTHTKYYTEHYTHSQNGIMLLKIKQTIIIKSIDLIFPGKNLNLIFGIYNSRINITISILKIFEYKNPI